MDWITRLLELAKWQQQKPQVDFEPPPIDSIPGFRPMVDAPQSPEFQPPPMMQAEAGPFAQGPVAPTGLGLEEPLGVEPEVPGAPFMGEPAGPAAPLYNDATPIHQLLAQSLYPEGPPWQERAMGGLRGFGEKMGDAWDNRGQIMDDALYEGQSMGRDAVDATKRGLWDAWDSTKGAADDGAYWLEGVLQDAKYGGSRVAESIRNLFRRGS